MPSPIDVRALADHRIWLRFSDGVEGEVDLSDFAGRGVFSAWGDEIAFDSVQIGDKGQIAWSDDLELCADNLYMRLTGKSPEEVFPNLGEMSLNA